MKDIPAKFRGKSCSFDCFIYGNSFERKKYIATINGWYVYIDSVEKLVGYDDDGKEIYKKLE